MELQDRFGDIEDITDPEAYNKVLIYLEELQEEDELFMEILVSKMYEMLITWEQPWYQKSRSLTRVFKKPDEEQETFRSDTISHAESEKIHKNWRRFRKLFDVPNTPICLARWKNTKQSKNPNAPQECARRFVAAFLAQGLERTLHQVYKHFVIRYAHHAKGNYFLWEEKVMAVCAYHMPRNPVPIVSYLLGRDPRGIYKKMQEAGANKAEVETETKFKPKQKWTLPLATKFLRLLMQYTSEHLENLKYKKIDMSVWRKLQDDMNLKYSYLHMFWNRTLHVQLFVKYDIKINKLRRSIFKVLRTYPYNVWTDIRWKELLKHYTDGFTHGFFYTICYRVARKMKNHLKAPLEEVIDFSLQEINKFPNRRLKTLALNNDQELVHVSYTDNNYKIY